MDPSHLHRISEGVNVVTGGERVSQWSIEETRDFLSIRAELDLTFMETKRNKLLWGAVSAKMKERGYNRSAEQCKSKWKNLVTRYKGYGMMEQGTTQQFPFYDEMQAIFANRMQRLLWMEAEGGSGSRKRGMDFSSDEEDEDVEKASGSGKKKKKALLTDSGTITCNSLKKMLEEHMKQQMQIEMEWMKRYEAREEERRMKEMEWRQTMEALEKERIMVEQSWREREEQRRMREEAKAEQRDALITVLLDKLRSQHF